MSKLIYITNISLDGYIEDQTGAFDFGDPEQTHPLVCELLRPVGTYLHGRRLYEKMSYWDGAAESYPTQFQEFARIWQKPEKVVYSRTLRAPTTRNTRIETDFDVDAIRKLKTGSDADITVGGAELASLALEAALIDEIHLIVHPVIFGGGKPALQTRQQRNLEPLESRHSGTAVVYTRYRVPTT